MFLTLKNRSQFRDKGQVILNEMLSNYVENKTENQTFSHLAITISKLGSSITRCECSAILCGTINGSKFKRKLTATYKSKNDKLLLGMFLGGAIGTAFILESETTSIYESDKKAEEKNVHKCMEMISYKAFEFLNNKTKAKVSGDKYLWISLIQTKWFLTFVSIAVMFYKFSLSMPKDFDFISKYSSALLPAIILGGFIFLILHLTSLVITPNRFYEHEYLGRTFTLASSLETPTQIKVRALISLVVLTLCFIGGWKLLFGY